MNRTLTAAALIAGLALAGCDSFDPLDKFQDWDIMGASKTPLRGDRRAVFPEGVPGVPQGVPPDMVKGYQPPAAEPPPVIEAKPAPQKQKKAAPRKQQRKQVQEEVEEDAPVQAPTARATTTQPAQQGPGGFQTMPGAQPTWPADAQPAPRR